MLIIALVLALIGLAALVFAVVTSNALVAWVCIGASVLGVLLLIVDALAERHRRAAPGPGESSAEAKAEPAPATGDEAATFAAADTVDGADEHVADELVGDVSADEDVDTEGAEEDEKPAADATASDEHNTG
jgi:uncharacterized membrane protein YdfJ with MMPL/SSD domain